MTDRPPGRLQWIVESDDDITPDGGEDNSDGDVLNRGPKVGITVSEVPAERVPRTRG